MKNLLPDHGSRKRDQQVEQQQMDDDLMAGNERDG
jgi:hypothetical protein